MPLVLLPPLEEQPPEPVTSDNRPLDIEALFTAIGLGPILAAKPTLHKYQLQRAAKLPAEMRRRVLAFIASDAFQPAHDVPEFDYPTTLRTVSAGKLDDAQARALHRVAPDFDADLAVQANKIFAWANPLMPRDTRPAVIGGTRPATPDPHTTSDFQRAWDVALTPTIVLDDLEDGSLSDDQVAVLKMIYPAIYAELRQAITEAMGSMQGRKGENWEPTPPKAALLSIIMGTQQFDADLCAAIQTMYAASPDAQPAVSGAARRKSTGGGSDESTEATPGQTAGAGMSTAG